MIISRNARGLALLGLLAIAVLAILMRPGREGGLVGEYDQVGGAGKMEFRGDRVYITALLGMTFVAPYEVDGDHIIVKGASGAQVFIRRGDTLDAGLGMTFMKRSGEAERAAAEE